MQVCHFQHLLRPFDKNEPSRFLGEGVFFKAKLIGILEVAEARGDRMCQEALADLKMAIRAAGEHKQRISVHVAIDGLRLRDEKTGDSLYHHPVHKISFIAQDMSDSRAFGYIFGSPDTGHRFFGIKTDKAASQVVIAMRDLFQVVFELKKKEIELAKQQLDGKSLLASSHFLSSTSHETSKNNDSNTSTTRSRLGTNTSIGAPGNGNGISGNSSGNAVAELVDLEQELSSLQRGIHQMERLTPPTDPFGDSFTSASVPRFLPPPPSSSRSTRTAVSVTSDGSSPFSPPPARTHFNFDTVNPITTASTTLPTTSLPLQTSPTTTISPGPSHQSPKNTLEQESFDKLSTEKIASTAVDTVTTPATSLPIDINQIAMDQPLSTVFDVFTELDPLGTGRSKPYVDKKHFFQELKNPPKKVLKDLVSENTSSVTDSLFQSKFDSSPKNEFLTTLTSVGRHSGGSVSIKPQTAQQIFTDTSMFTADPFAETDPFDNTDPFAESLKDDPFLNSTLDFANNVQSDFSNETKFMPSTVKETTLPETRIGCDQASKINFLCAALKSDIVPLQVPLQIPLQVSLPPEPSCRSPKLSKQISIENKSSVRQRPHSGKQQQQPPQQQQIQPSSSPPPPLPPKKPIERVNEVNIGPPLPLPARRRQTPSTQSSSTPPNTSLNWLSPSNTLDDDYLAPAPTVPRRPMPTSTTPSPGLDITLAQLLTCGMDELASRLRMPAEVLSRMTLAQLTSHLHDYLQTVKNNIDKPEAVVEKSPQIVAKPTETPNKNPEFIANFDENFTSHTDTFEANFDSFNKSNKSSYDRYAVFREIEAEVLKTQPAVEALVSNHEEHDSLSSQPDLPCDSSILHSNDPVTINKTLDDINENVNTIPISKAQSSSPKTKLEELKNVISNIQKISISPTPDIEIPSNSNIKSKENESKSVVLETDRYAALRDLSIIDDISRPLSTELTEDPEPSAPLQVPKERKKSDEKSDGFDHSDFFDCIDNSLSLTNQEDAFRKSPMVAKDTIQSPEKTPEPPKATPIQLEMTSQLASGSISDVASGSSPEIALTGSRDTGTDRDRERDSNRKGKSRRRGDAWALLPSGRRSSPPVPSEDGASPWSSDSKESPPQQVKWTRNYPEPSRRHRRNPKSWHTRQTSSSSRDVSPWEEDPPVRDSVSHTRSYHRESRLESGGSCERRDSGGSRERRDSGSGRDRHRRRHKSRDDDDEWSEGRMYGSNRHISPCTRSSSREMRRERPWPGEDHWRPDERGYSTVGRREGSRRRGEPPWQVDESSHRYSCTMGNRSWRRSGSSGEGDRRSGGGSSGAERSRTRLGPSLPSSHRSRPTRHRSHRSPYRDDYFRDRDRSPSPPPASPTSSRMRHQHHFFYDFNQSEADSPITPKTSARYRFSNDFSEKDSPKSQNSPFENDFVDNANSRKPSKYEGPYGSLEKQSPVTKPLKFNRFWYEKELSSENLTGSPASLRPPHASPPNSARSLFEDDFSPEPRNGILRTSEASNDNYRNNSIPEGEEAVTVAREERTEKVVGFDFGPGKDSSASESRRNQKVINNKQRSKQELDIKKSESVNIFARDSDPFDGDEFFTCTASDKPKKDNWQGDFANFDDI